MISAHFSTPATEEQLSKVCDIERKMKLFLIEHTAGIDEFDFAFMLAKCLAEFSVRAEIPLDLIQKLVNTIYQATAELSASNPSKRKN